MSSANPVPETFDLTWSDVKETLAKAGRARLLHDAFERLRASDGFSHARSMAFLTALVGSGSEAQVRPSAVGAAS
jgi:hypothetical protein